MGATDWQCSNIMADDDDQEKCIEGTEEIIGLRKRLRNTKLRSGLAQNDKFIHTG